MNAETSSQSEHARLSALGSYHLPDTFEDSDFDELTELAALMCGTPIAGISMVDQDHQWFISIKGLPASKTDRMYAFCNHTILNSQDIFEVTDAREDERFRNNPLVAGEPKIAFYAGVPLVNEDGYALGALCVIDYKKNELSAQQQLVMKILAHHVISRLELKRKVLQLQDAEDIAKQQNVKLRESEDRLRTAIQSAEMGTWSVNLKTDELTISDQTRRLHGIGDRLPLTLNASLSMINPEHRRQVAQQIADAVQTGAQFVVEYELNPMDGSKTRWLRSTGIVSTDKEGKPERIAGTILDVTERKQDDQRKSDFIGMVSHELKTPLTSLNAYLQMLQAKAKKAEDAFTSGALDKSVKQVKKMRVMINGFLNLSRLESGKLHIDRQVFDMATLIEEMEEEYRDMLNTHRIIFAPTENALVYADSDKVGQVINNFISNAVKYSPLGTIIEVACISDNGWVQVSVKDEGVGVAQEDLDKLFDRYYRVEGKQMENIAGFGIGLYLSAEIIERHVGTIWAESKVGEGSTFYFKLPLSE